MLKAKDRDAVVTGRSTGAPVRALKNKLTREYAKLEAAGASKEELKILVWAVSGEHLPKAMFRRVRLWQVRVRLW